MQKVEAVEVRKEIEMGLTDPVSIHVKVAVFKRIGVDRQLVIQKQFKRADPATGVSPAPTSAVRPIALTREVGGCARPNHWLTPVVAML